MPIIRAFVAFAIAIGGACMAATGVNAVACIPPGSNGVAGVCTSKPCEDCSDRAMVMVMRCTERNKLKPPNCCPDTAYCCMPAGFEKTAERQREWRDYLPLNGIAPTPGPALTEPTTQQLSEWFGAPPCRLTDKELDHKCVPKSFNPWLV